MLDYKKTGKFICEERQKRNITQEELGDQLYVTRQAVSKWERGKCMPDYDSLLRLGEIFSLSLNEIIAGERKSIHFFLQEIFKFFGKSLNIILTIR